MTAIARVFFIGALLMILDDARAQPRIAPPVVPPYAPDRSFVEADFIRFDWQDRARDRDVPAKLYYPPAADKPLPVIVFSHGLGGTREAYEYLARQWTANGYVCVHLQHPGSDDSVWRGKTNRMEAMRRAANAQNAIDRASDVRFAIDQLESLNASDEKLKGRLDLKHIGMSGHSFGAQTTFLVVGQKLGGRIASDRTGDLSDPRISAALPMSATVPVNRSALDEIFGDIRVPVFLMTGTDDTSPLNDTKAADRRLPFDHLTSTPAYLLTLEAGDHMVFSGRRVDKPTDPEHQKLIRLASTAFWDAFLKDDVKARQWLDDGEFKTLLAQHGTFEQK